MCRVLSKHAAGTHHGAIYIGRGSKWGTPFRIGVDGDRATVIAKHAHWLRPSNRMNVTVAVSSSGRGIKPRS
jgi:hypothetical protein